MINLPLYLSVFPSIIIDFRLSRLNGFELLVDHLTADSFVL